MASGIVHEGVRSDAPAHEKSPRPGDIFAAGFNAHAQLRIDSTNDLTTFTRMFDEASIQNGEVLFAGWSSTVLTTSETMTSLGNETFSHAIAQDPGTSSPHKLHCAIGDHDGIKACLDKSGNLYNQIESGKGLKNVTSEISPHLSRIAGAQNGRTAVTFKQAPKGLLCHIVEFADFKSLIAWYRDPSGESNYPPLHYMLPGRPKQMIANTATFMVLMEDGSVYSWGDPRLRSLGRPINGEGASSAREPALITALGGLDIVKISSGGWLSAALAADGALYIWGAASPGSGHSLKCLREAEAEEIVLVDIKAKDSEPLDIVDMAVGDHHIAAVAADGSLFVVGDNRNGQLGLEALQIFVEDWTKVPSLCAVRCTSCGPKSTFALT